MLRKLLSFSRRIAFVYVLVICLLFIIHFKIADDFTYKHVKLYSEFRCRFGCSKNTAANGNGNGNIIIPSRSVLQRKDSQYSEDEDYVESSNNNDDNDDDNNNDGNGTQPPQNKRPSQTTPNPSSSTRVKPTAATYYNERNRTDSSNSSSSSSGGRETLKSDAENEDPHHQNLSLGNGGAPLPPPPIPRPLFPPPQGERPERRFPQTVIIGFTKCGTRALIEFMSLHPYIKVARNEVHYYDKDENFDNGLDWYHQQMPLSYSNQVTVEKTPAYVLTPRARDEIFKLTPTAKLIMLVRDPVVRLVSQFLLRFRVNNAGDHTPVTAIYRNNKTGLFDPESRPVDIGNYQKHIIMWLERFPLSQMLIINSEDLTRDPLPVIQRVEKFLEIPALYSKENVYYNETSGFYCPKGFEPSAVPRCLGKTKGLVHPKLPAEDRTMLYKYYRPYNEKLFRILGYGIDWTEKEWGKEVSD